MVSIIFFFSSQAMIGAGGATKWIYTHFSFFFSSTPTEYAMKLYVVFRVGIFSLNIFQLLCGRDGMKSFSERFFSNFFLFRFSGYRIHMDCVDRRLLKSIWLIASNICKNWQHKSNIFGRWNCHTQNRAGHASRDRGFEWKIKRWFCNCINTIVNSSETLSFFFVRFAFCILLLSSVGWHNECRKKNCANRFAPSHFGCVLVFFSVNSLERFHFEQGVSVCHTSAAVAAGGITVYGVRFGVNIFYLFISPLTNHWSDLLFYVCAFVSFNFWFTRCVGLVRIFWIKNWLRTLYKCTRNTRNKH